MGWRRSTSASGQTEAEFALVVAGIAVACIVAVLFLGGAVGGLWDRSTKPVAPSTFDPPNASVTEPMSMQDCEGDGWRSFPQFATQQACFDFVAGLNP
jgi:Flp pilus assembly pilin Flp